jgi:catechol 2,3-dioxygenase-like lactoylglutathione lyase family enzyme
MARGIDHIVHAVRDLDAAAALYRALGFQVGARNRHPPAWGTQNHIVQLDGCFIELLTVAEPDGIVPHRQRFFSFGAHNRDALARGEGLSMLVLEGRDTAAEARAFRDAGIGDFETFDFEREGRRPDGTAIKVAFSLAFARDPRAPEIGYFTCRQRYPENFWNTAFQIHENTAATIAGAVIVARQPADHAAFLRAFAGQSDVDETAGGLRIETPRGEIEVVTPAAFAAHYGAPPPGTTGSAWLAGLRIAVRDLDALDRVLERSAIAARRTSTGRAVGPHRAMGATLIFDRIGAAGTGRPS